MSTEIPSKNWLYFNETSWELLVSKINVNITCMFWFDDFTNSYGSLINVLLNYLPLHNFPIHPVTLETFEKI